MPTASLSTSEIAKILAGELIIVRGCPDAIEEQAAIRAEHQILEVLTGLVDVDGVSDGRKEKAAGLMGQYIFNDMCGLGMAGYEIDFANYPLDQARQQEYLRGLNG